MRRYQRIIGIRHRRKKTAEGEARPTEVCIKQGSATRAFKLEDDTAELDFMLGRFPIEWRPVVTGESVVWFDRETAPHGFRPHQCKWRVVKSDEDMSELNDNHLRVVLTERGLPVQQALVKVPTAFEGFRTGDAVAMVLGGSGDRFAAALSRRGEKINAHVFRIPPYAMQAARGEADKSDDHLTLVEVFTAMPSAFYALRKRDRLLVQLNEVFLSRQETQRDRIRCGQRVLGRLVGNIFLNEEGEYPEGRIEDDFDALRANDVIYAELLKEEKKRDSELKKVFTSLDVWQLLADIKGCGPRLAGVIAPVRDVRRFMVLPDPVALKASYARGRELEQRGRFAADRDKVAGRVTAATTEYQELQMVRSWKKRAGKTEEAALLGLALDEHRLRRQLRLKATRRGMAKLKAYCGVHVLYGGKHGDIPPEKQFPRRRLKQKCNWSPLARQALYLLVEQFNRRPTTEWGKKLLQYKANLRQKHPEPVEVEVQETKNGRTVTVKKKRFTNGHIHKMAGWRTASRFIEWLYLNWVRLEEGKLKLREPGSDSGDDGDDVLDRDSENQGPEALLIAEAV